MVKREWKMYEKLLVFTRRRMGLFLDNVADALTDKPIVRSDFYLYTLWTLRTYRHGRTDSKSEDECYAPQVSRE
jgi:hypothetical protein